MTTVREWHGLDAEKAEFLREIDRLLIRKELVGVCALRIECLERFDTMQAARCPRCGKVSHQPKKKTIWYCPHCGDVDLKKNWVREADRP